MGFIEGTSLEKAIQDGPLDAKLQLNWSPKLPVLSLTRTIKALCIAISSQVISCSMLAANRMLPILDWRKDRISTRT